MKLHLLLFLFAFCSSFLSTESSTSLRALMQEEEEHHHGDEEIVVEEGLEDHHSDANGVPLQNDEEHNEGYGYDDEHHDEGEEHDHEDELHHHEGDEHDHGDEQVLASRSTISDKPWGAAIGAALLVNLATLIGVVVLVPTMLRGRFYKSSFNKQRLHWILHTLVPSCASGALLATAVFLIIPESILLIGSATGAAEHEHRALQEDNAEGEMAWKFGASFLGGFLLPILMACLVPHGHNKEQVPECPVCEEEHSVCDFEATTAVPMDFSFGSVSTCDGDVCHEENHDHDEDEEEAHDIDSGTTCDDRVQQEDQEEEVTTPAAPTKPKKRPINYRLAVSLFMGDFFHNFADGIFIGTAFSLCDRNIAVAIAAVTAYHELAQELADYFLLTQHCGLSPVMALVLNFLNGLSIVFGVILVLALDVSMMAVGCILAVSAGVYVHIAASECIPRLEKELKSLKDRLFAILFFVLGVVPIGLVLLNHGHCTE